MLLIWPCLYETSPAQQHDTDQFPTRVANTMPPSAPTGKQTHTHTPQTLGDKSHHLSSHLDAFTLGKSHQRSHHAIAPRTASALFKRSSRVNRECRLNLNCLHSALCQHETLGVDAIALFRAQHKNAEGTSQSRTT